MELNWSTFVLEIINFLVLVWILKRFLYRPVLGALRQRQERIEQQIDDAKRIRADAETLQAQYEGRLSEWGREKREALDKLSADIQAERQKRLEELDREISAETEKARVVTDRHLAEERDQLRQEAHIRGARFAAKLLERVAGPEVHARLFTLFMESLDSLSRQQREALRQSVPHGPAPISVVSAIELSAQQKATLEPLLAEAFGSDADAQYSVAPELIAGLCLRAGAWELQLNIRNELQGFLRLSNDAGTL